MKLFVCGDAMIQAQRSLDLLKEGNSRYVNNPALYYSELGRVRLETAQEQKPLAVVIACADSRMPVELIFHCLPGELFVIRVAGNILNPDIIGSIEYAIVHLKTNLIVVLGHSSCGAVTAALNAEPLSAELDGLIKKIHLHPHSHDVNENAVYNANVIAKELQHKLNEWDTKHRHIRVVSAFSGVVDFQEEHRHDKEKK